MQKGCDIKATGKLKEFAFHPLGWRLDQSQDIMFPPAVFRERELLYLMSQRFVPVTVNNECESLSQKGSR
jgi:hypothetical protein